MTQLEHGARPRIASDGVLRKRLRAAMVSVKLKGFSERFLRSEWTNVVDAWRWHRSTPIDRAADGAQEQAGSQSACPPVG
jgi:hypothetical protein